VVLGAFVIQGEASRQQTGSRPDASDGNTPRHYGNAELLLWSRYQPGQIISKSGRVDVHARHRLVRRAQRNKEKFDDG
jgi:hypothetical protein